MRKVILAVIIGALLASLPLSAAATVPNTLYPGQSLLPGQFLQSSSGRYRLIDQRDGNLVLYDRTVTIWATHTKTGYRLFMPTAKADPGFALGLYSAAGTPVWFATGCDYCFPSEGFHKFVVQNDGNAVLYVLNERVLGWSPAWDTLHGGI